MPSQTLELVEPYSNPSNNWCESRKFVADWFRQYPYCRCDPKKTGTATHVYLDICTDICNAVQPGQVFALESIELE